MQDVQHKLHDKLNILIFCWPCISIYLS